MGLAMNVMPRAQNSKRKQLTREERRERRLLRQEKQRKDNIGRAAKMHAARLQMEAYEHGKSAAGLKASTYVGCSGWFYWNGGNYFIPMTCPRVNGFVTTRSASTPLRSTRPFIRRGKR
jgi:hypothetical protein